MTISKRHSAALAGSASHSSSDAEITTPVHRSDTSLYIVGLLFGASAGFVEVRIGDLLLTAFVVCSCAMLLGLLRPDRPWRWALLIATCIPLSRLFAAKVIHEYTELAQIYESFFAFLPGIVGCYAGAVLRRVVDMLMKQPQSRN